MESINTFFPECVARVPVSLWGLEVEGVFARRCATVRNRSQPFAVNWGEPYGRASGESAKAVTFGGFKGRATSFRVAGVALCDIPTCFHDVSKVVCVWQAQYFRVVFRRCVAIFRGRRCTWVETSIVMSRGRRSTSDVSCCASERNVRAASSGDNVQIAWQAWHFVTCDEN